MAIKDATSDHLYQAAIQTRFSPPWGQWMEGWAVKVVILGSGATAGTLPECPTVAGFGEALTLRTRPRKWTDVYPALARAVADTQGEGTTCVDQWNLSTVWTRIDYYSKLHGALGTSDYSPGASYDLHRAVLDVYGLLAKERVAELLASHPSFKLREIISTLRAGDVLVSFNWDVVAELIAERTSVPLIQAPHPVPAEAIRLAKPHGSVSWPHRSRRYLEFQRPGGRPGTAPMSPDDVVPGEVQPFFLGAVPIKSELIREVQAAAGTNAFEVVQSQWFAFVEAVRNAHEIVVVGYSFPQEDEYGRFLLREASQQRRKDARPILLQYYELADRMAEVGKAILQTFGEKNIQIQWCGAVEAPRSSG